VSIGQHTGQSQHSRQSQHTSAESAYVSRECDEPPQRAISLGTQIERGERDSREHTSACVGRECDEPP
jgi:hypothetical protein